MTMTFKTRVQDARNIQDALVTLAEGIDRLLAAVPAEPPVDPWDTWPADTQTSLPNVTALRDQLTLTDELQTVDALQAAIRLAEDDGTPVDNGLPQGVREQVTVGEDSIEVACRPVDQDRYVDRVTFAREIGLGPDCDPAILHEVAVEAFAKGGPSWLYNYDRAFVVGMPTNWKQALVDDVEQDSLREAAELGRDILKDLSGGMDQQSQLASLYGRR